MVSPFARLSTLRLAWLLLAAWALLVQGFGTEIGDRLPLQPDTFAVLCVHGGAGGTPSAPGLPDTCTCPVACAAAVLLPAPPAPSLPNRIARVETRGARPGVSTIERPRFSGPPPGRGPPFDLA